MYDLAGSPLSEWVWLKESFPSSHGGLNIRRTSLHAAAAYFGSLVQTQDLVDRMLDRTPEPSIYLVDTVAALADAAETLDSNSLDYFDVSLSQRSLSHCIDEASYNHFLTSAPEHRLSPLPAEICPLLHPWTPSSGQGVHTLPTVLACFKDVWEREPMSHLPEDS